jgi:hypothetical protein
MGPIFIYDNDGNWRLVPDDWTPEEINELVPLEWMQQPVTTPERLARRGDRGIVCGHRVFGPFGGASELLIDLGLEVAVLTMLGPLDAMMDADDCMGRYVEVVDISEGDHSGLQFKLIQEGSP